jgi:hypothetical protein
MATTQIAPTDLQRLERAYRFADKPTILHFLADNPFLVPLLFEAREAIEQFFPGTPTSLEVLPDPITGDDYHRQLMIFIESDLEAVQAVDRLREFDDQWWLDVVPRTDKALGTMLGAAREL